MMNSFFWQIIRGVSIILIDQIYQPAHLLKDLKFHHSREGGNDGGDGRYI
jgi:hypothetical protein